MNIFEIIGFIATTLTTACSLPQLVKIIKTKDSKSVSFLMYFMMTIGYALWIVYGVYSSSLQIILGNAIGSLILGTIMTIKLMNMIKGVDEKEFPFIKKKHPLDFSHIENTKKEEVKEVLVENEEPSVQIVHKEEEISSLVERLKNL